MSGSIFLKIVIGLAVFLIVIIYQNGKLRKMAPSLKDFSHPVEVSGPYSYEAHGRGAVTRAGNKVIFCGVDYSGGNASCIVPLMGVPQNSQISVSVSSIKTSGGYNILYVNSVMFNGREVYTELPEKSLSDWWFGSRLQSLMFPFVIIILYVFIVFTFFTDRG